jgi:MFS transporter, PPP family, 3-phenylpropionic acid transporter
MPSLPTPPLPDALPVPVAPYWRLAAWYFFYFAFIGAFAPYFTLYLQSLGLTAPEIAMLMSLNVAMRLVAPNLWGWLADRLGRKAAVVKLSALLSAAGFLTFFFVTDFWALFIGMVLISFFWSAALPLVEALTLRHLEGRAEHYGRIRLWGSVGFIVAVLGTGVWLDRAPLASLLWVNLGLLLGIVASAWLLADAPVRADEVSPPLRSGLLRPEVLALLAACFLMSAAHGPFYVFYSIHLVDHGYDKTAVGALWSLGVMAEIAVFLAMPRLMRRWPVRTILQASFALAVIRFLTIGWGADHVWLLLAAQLMHGATFGAYHAAAVAALHRLFPSRQQARVQALYGSISFGAGGMAGNLVSGAAWDGVGPGLTFTLGSVFALVGLLFTWRGMAAARK